MSEGALSLAFFDRARNVHGTVRQGLTVLFENGRPRALDEELRTSRNGVELAAAVGDELELTFEPLCDPADVGGASVRVCGVRGRVGGAQVDCLGVVTDTTEAPRWAELDALRSLCALFDPTRAVLAVARRPRGAPAHGAEEVVAWLLGGGALNRVGEARVSTVYDAEGRQRHVGLELWMPGEDFPRRASGSAVAGTTLTFEGLRVNAAVIDWRMEGREGAGAYELTVRDEREAA
ncbi:MAG: hypothetical protein IRZ21_10690 [Thermoleophilaceae bacterium]|nr:hypothetical protein [Thermoleophilaceae bacterium]